MTATHKHAALSDEPRNVLVGLCDMILEHMTRSEPPSEEFLRIVPDLISVTLAGSATKSARALSAQFPSMGSSDGNARVWGQGRMVAVRDAVLCNAFAAHVLDFDDDETEVAMAHISATVVSAALTLCDAATEPVDGRSLYAALAAGYDVALALGDLTNPQMYRAGWHATSTLGSIAAAATCGRLLELNAEQMANALGLAASLSGGVRGAFGADGKSLQVAQAASSGLLAAQLAKAGMVSTEEALAGARGFLGLHNAKEKPIRPAGKLPPPGFVVKAFPSCTATHAAIAALLDAVSEMPAGTQINRIECLVDPFVPGILLKGVPASPDAARFSLGYCLARAALDKKLGPESFTPEALRSAEVMDLYEKVEIGVDASLPKGPSGVATGAHVTLHFADGQLVRKSRLAAPGSAASPLSDGERLAKFVRCLEPFCDAESASAHFRCLLTLHQVSDVRAALDPLLELTLVSSSDNLEQAL